MFWEGQTNLTHPPFFIFHYFVASNCRWKMWQIFVAFPEYLNFNSLFGIHRRFSSDYLSSDPWKNYPSRSKGIFGFVWSMFSTDAKMRAYFPTFFEARAPRRHSYWGKNRVKISLLFLTSETQDFESEHPFESHEHLQSAADLMLVFTSF